MIIAPNSPQFHSCNTTLEYTTIPAKVCSLEGGYVSDYSAT
jgi:hypothetical protein